MKKFLVILTLISMVFTATTSVYALEANIINDESMISPNSTATEKSAIIDILNFVALDKEAVGLENVDFSQLKIGNKLYRYEVTENGFEVTGYSYPIMYNGNVVLIATGAGERFQITTFEAELIKESGLDHIALVYDSDGLYLYDGSRFELAHEYVEFMEDERESVQNIMRNSVRSVAQLTDEIVVTNLNTSENLYSEDAVLSVASASANGYYAATVDYVSQNGYNICWAACVAMLTNTLNGFDYSAEDIAIAYLGEDDMENGLDFADVREILQGDVIYTSIMDDAILDDCFCDNDYSYKTYTISDKKIQYCMQDYRPIIAGFIRAGGYQGNHACVIDAIHTTADYIRVCDPNTGRIYAERDYINEDQDYYGEYTYICPETGRLYYMVEQISTYY